MPDSRDAAPGAWSVFLISTVRDLRLYRRAVRDACRRRAQTICLLSEEDWPGGYDETVDKCIRQIASVDGFLLIIGYWYGSVPPDADRSITHLEFDTALKKWREWRSRPMAVLLPAAGSHADRELRKAARQILERDKLDAASHDTSLQRFRSTVLDSWRTVDAFKNKNDLRELVIARCLEFKGYKPSAAAAGSVTIQTTAAANQVTDGQLGALGREPQLAAVKTILANLAERPDVPAVAIVVSGTVEAGQRALLLRLMATIFKKYSPRREPSTLPVKCNAEAMVAWVTQLLGLSPATMPTPEALADAAAVELKRQPLIFAIDRVGDLADGVNTFYREFWLRFYGALHRVRPRERFNHRLVALVADYTGDCSAFAGSTTESNAPDYSFLIRVPLLGNFTRADILQWFDEMDVPDDLSGRRATLADRVMKDSRGVPLRAFDRLRGEVLWPSGDRDE